MPLIGNGAPAGRERERRMNEWWTGEPEFAVITCHNEIDGNRMYERFDGLSGYLASASVDVSARAI